MKLHKRILGEGTPVVILHGLLGSSDNWQSFGRKLSEKGYKVYMVDLRNHGLSPHSNELNFDVMSEDVKELFDEENLASAVLIGHSLGGKTAMKFAFEYPERISGLVVIDISPRYYSVHHRQILDTLLSIDTTTLSSRKEAEEQIAKGISEVSTQQFLLKNLHRKEKDQFAWRFNLDAINEHIENVGEAVYPKTPFEMKTLFVKGEKSNYISYDDEKEIFDHFTNVEIKTALGAGHWVHADNPDYLIDAVEKFIESSIN